jgi:hypothetical protein
MGWRGKTLLQGHNLIFDKNLKWSEFPRWLKFKFKLINFINDFFTWEEIKSIWKTPRLHFKLWIFYKKHPYLRKDYK